MTELRDRRGEVGFLWDGEPERLTILNDLTVHNCNIRPILTDLPISCTFFLFLPVTLFLGPITYGPPQQTIRGG